MGILNTPQDDEGTLADKWRIVHETTPDDMFYRRMDTKKLIKTQEEYIAAQLDKVPIEIVTYSHAVALMKESEAASRKKQANRKKAKAARKARKGNR